MTTAEKVLPPGSEVRQTIRNDDVATLRSRLASVAAVPADAPARAAAASLATHKVYTQFVDDTVLNAVAVLDATGLVQWVTERINQGKKKTGRPARVNVRALLVSMLLAVLNNQGTLVTAFRDVLFHRISTAMQDELQVAPLVAATLNTVTERHDKAAYAATRRALFRMLDTMDPAIHGKGRKRTWEELDAAKRDLTEDEQQQLQAALDAFNTLLLSATRLALPDSALQAWDGSACIDATPMKLWARGRAKNDTRASTDPDGGYYSRGGAHGEEDDPTAKRNTYALELHTMVASDVSHPDRLYMPSVALGVAAARPGVDPAGNARRIFAAVAETGHAPGYLTGDGLYTDQMPEKYQDEARKLGWKLILAFPDKHLGVKTIHGHVIGVEGDLYCPSMPQQLIDATIDYRAGTIDKTVFDKRIAARAAYLMRPHEKPRNGQVRYDCPASGNCPQVMCPLKAASMRPHPTTVTPTGQKIDTRPVITTARGIDQKNPPPVCRQNTITIPDTVNSRYRQSVRFGTEEYDRLYATLRNAQEGYHGFAKDEAKEALAEPGKRRIPGLAAQSVFAGFVYLAANIRKIQGFMRDAKPDEHGHLYVDRPKIKALRASKPEPTPVTLPIAA